MTKTELQTEVMDWLSGLPDEEYDAAAIVALGPEQPGNKRSNVIGFKGSQQTYMDCIGALAENGAKHGYLGKTLKINP